MQPKAAVRQAEAANRALVARQAALKDIRKRVQDARIGLVLDAPFFGVLASRLKIVEDPTCETMWTDSVSVGYNPDWVDTISNPELKGTWAHEVVHVTNGHCWRMGTREPEMWNEACDESANPIVLAAGFVLPEGALLDPRFAGKPAELIYETLRKERPEPQPQQSKQQSKDGKDQNQQDGSGQGDSKGDSSKGAKSKGKGGQGKSGDKGKDQQDASGSAPSSGGQPSKKPMAGEVRPAPPGTDIAKLEQEWRTSVESAAIFAASHGDLPGYLVSLLGEFRKPQVDWREALWQFVQQSFYSPDYRWSRPNRNYMAFDLYLPSLVGEEMPEVVVGEDTSYSVYKALTEQFRSEMSAILEQMRPRKIYHLQADTRISRVTEMEVGDEFNNEVAGRGGTDFRPVFDWVNKEGLSPACVIYMSDLDGPFPAQEPDYPVLWVCPPGSKNPPWGTKLEIPFEQYQQ